MRIAFTRWRYGGLLNRPSPRKRLLAKKKTSSGFEFVSGLADGASAMPAKWSRPVFSFRFYEGKNQGLRGCPITTPPGQQKSQSILHVASKPDMKALRRIDNLPVVVALADMRSAPLIASGLYPPKAAARFA